MAEIKITDLDEAVFVDLKARARERGISVEDAAREALAAGLGLHRHAALARIDAIRSRIGEVAGPSVVDDLRDDRARDG